MGPIVFDFEVDFEVPKNVQRLGGGPCGGGGILCVYLNSHPQNSLVTIYTPDVTPNQSDWY